VSRIYGDDYFRTGGAGYVDYLGNAAALRAQGRRYAAIAGRYAAPGRVLDVGAAAGFILAGLLDCGWSGAAIEPNAAMARYAADHLGIDVSTSPLHEFRTTEPFDLVMMIQVIGHFVALRESLAAAAAATKPGGFWLIETWDRDSLPARLLGPSWHEYSPPSVVQWFSAGGLRTLAGQFGFREIARGRPRKWISGANARSLLEHTLADTRWRALTPLIAGVIPRRIVIPYPSLDVFWALFQRP
jgi:SAM-dependent methyltransferase